MLAVGEQLPLATRGRAPLASKNIVKYCGFIVFAYRNHILQQDENCVNSGVFARHWPKTNVATMIFATWGNKDIVNTVIFGFRSAKNIGIYSVFLLQGFQKMRKHRLYDLIWRFLGVVKNATIRSVAKDDDEEDDDDEDDEDNEDDKRRVSGLPSGSFERL